MSDSLILVAGQYNMCPKGFALVLSRAMVKTIRNMGTEPDEAVVLLTSHLSQTMSKELH